MHTHPLIQTLSNFCTLPAELIPEILGAFKILELPREKVLLREGFTNRNVYFLYSGIIRRYYASKLGHQRTTAFITERGFFTDLESFERRKGSFTTFTVERDCIVYSLEYFKLLKMMEDHPQIAEGFNNMKSYYVKLAAEKRMLLNTEPVESRVKMMLEEHPQIMDVCRKKDIISYLRTNSQTFNFILKNLLVSHC